TSFASGRGPTPAPAPAASSPNTTPNLRNASAIIPLTGESVGREEVLSRLRERIVQFAASHLSRDAAEDLAQEVLILLHEKYPHVEGADELLPLSLKIMRFKMIAWRRKTARRGEFNPVSIDDF